jgi:xanthine/uracil permease
MSQTTDSIWNRRFLKFLTLKSIIGMLVGVIAGYIYYIKIGCNSGSCPITSNPWLTMLWGLMMGYLLGDMFNKEDKKEA